VNTYSTVHSPYFNRLKNWKVNLSGMKEPKVPEMKKPSRKGKVLIVSCLLLVCSLFPESIWTMIFFKFSNAVTVRIGLFCNKIHF
jgi:hypothetical protein